MQTASANNSSDTKKNRKIKISGAVTDAKMNPIAGVLIFVDQVYTNTVTDSKGRYRVRVDRTAKQISAFSTWLYRVALNTAIDIIRKQYLQPIHSALSKNGYNITAPENSVGSDNKDILYQAINQLSDIDKAIIILYLGNYNYKEIAEIIGISESNIGVKINRIKTQLIKILSYELALCQLPGDVVSYHKY